MEYRLWLHERNPYLREYYNIRKEERQPLKPALAWCIRPIVKKVAEPVLDEENTQTTTPTTNTTTTGIDLNNDEDEKDLEGQLRGNTDDFREDRKKKPKSDLILKDHFIELPKYSPYLFININYFFNAGGINFICDLIANGTTIANLVAGLEILNGIYYFLEDEFAEKNIFERIAQPVRELPYRISDEEIKVSRKEDFVKLLKFMEVINRFLRLS